MALPGRSRTWSGTRDPLLTIALVLGAMAVYCNASCPNRCSGHGQCGGKAECSCFTGWAGGDCSLRELPAARSRAGWMPCASLRLDPCCSCPYCCLPCVAAQAGVRAARLGQTLPQPLTPPTPSQSALIAESATTNLGDAPATPALRARLAIVVSVRPRPRHDPCSIVTLRSIVLARGDLVADCAVRCPDDCSGHGLCQTMRAAAGDHQIGARSLQYTSPWDADKIAGCVCDPGWSGYDCSQLGCTTGDDPLTGSQSRPVQVLRCDLATTAQETFRIAWNGGLSPEISPSFTAVDLQSALEAIPGIGEVGVVIESSSGTLSTICSSPSGSMSTGVVKILLRWQHASSPSLVLKHADGRQLDGVLSNQIVTALGGEGLSRSGDSTVVLSKVGTVEQEECSGRGSCLATGDCRCFTGFASSDRQGQPGSFQDCGYNLPNMVPSACSGLTSGGVPCSGHGRCSGSPSWRCECDSGFAGGDCSYRACPRGPSWFDRPRTASNVAHYTSECSDMGFCDRRRGQCDCRPGFGGAACSVLQCPGSTLSPEWEELAAQEGVHVPPEPRPCSGHGQCLSMRRLADFASSNGVPVQASYGENPGNLAAWDADSVLGCLCDEGWEGHDCSRVQCQSGNDPANDHVPGALQFPEQQTLTCIYSQGSPSFKLSFRGHSTPAMPHASSASELQAVLQDLESIGSIDVSFAAGLSTACSTGSGTTITFQFLTEHGDLPAISVPQLDGHQSTELTVPAEATEARRGNTENVPCNNRGLCNRGTGSCTCFPGWGASDGAGRAGLLDDCGHRAPYALRANGLDPILQRKFGPGSVS
jgi:hypothetical protein